MIDELKNRLSKIEEGCSICKAKMCNYCPNSNSKKKIRAELSSLGFIEKRSESFFERLKVIFKQLKKIIIEA